MMLHVTTIKMYPAHMQIQLTMTSTPYTSPLSIRTHQVIRIAKLTPFPKDTMAHSQLFFISTMSGPTPPHISGSCSPSIRQPHFGCTSSV
eukprot:15155937-Ditylum_brightwellii.AAC.1